MKLYTEPESTDTVENVDEAKKRSKKLQMILYQRLCGQLENIWTMLPFRDYKIEVRQYITTGKGWVLQVSKAQAQLALMMWHNIYLQRKNQYCLNTD